MWYQMKAYYVSIAAGIIYFIHPWLVHIPIIIRTCSIAAVFYHFAYFGGKEVVRVCGYVSCSIAVL